MNIAIVRLSSLGDIIFSMASLQLIRRRFPDAAITWVADSRFADVLDYNPDLSQVVKLDLKGLKRRFSVAGLKMELSKLRGAGSFDLVIDMHGMIKAAVIACCLGKRRFGFHWSSAKEPLAALFYQETCRVPSSLTGVRRFAALAGNALGFAADETEMRDHAPFLFYSTEDQEAVHGFFTSGTPNVVMVAGTSMAYKDYPAAQLAEVARGLDARVLVCHGNDRELETAGMIASGAPNAVVMPRLDINRLKAAIGMADLVIGGDTGPTHMAWAMNVPSLTLFGSTPANCIVATDRNRVITSGSEPNYDKTDSSDFSIRTIPADSVIRAASDLLDNALATERLSAEVR